MRTVKLKSMIESEIEVLLKKLKAGDLRDTIGEREQFPDEGDQASAWLEENLAFMLKDREWSRLQLLKDALDRIHEGSFGICEECKGTIPEKRLRLYPAATHCVKCQSRAEHLLKRNRVSGMIH